MNRKNGLPLQCSQACLIKNKANSEKQKQETVFLRETCDRQHFAVFSTVCRDRKQRKLGKKNRIPFSREKHVIGNISEATKVTNHAIIETNLLIYQKVNHKYNISITI